MRFFRQHFFPHEPLYFLMGWEDPQVKFQISFKYRLFNADEDDPGWAVRQVPQLANLYLGYTQTSLWDTAAESAPFYDTAYKPEFFYQTTRIDQGRWAPWFGMDAQGGFQHASNGQDGPESRSLNVAYVMPTFYFGDVKKFHFRFAPRVYTYVGSLEDNPDIADYYGHVQLRAMVGWTDGAQLSVIGTIGDGFNYGSTQLDLTYPLYRLAGGSIAVYLDLQYFTGYGETLLDYNVRSSAFRAGFSLWR
jgi:outer membrane phospholipase A